MESAEKEQIYRPILTSRRGELIAWGSSFLVVILWLVLGATGQQVMLAIPVIAVILFGAALSISLGRVAFTNGLRNVEITWEEIQEVRAIPARWGKKVQVIGEKSYFGFQTLAEVTMMEEVKGRFGFVEGEDILRQIVLSSQLHIVERPGEGYYYARE
jgi:hypothetical protein